ncbi:hypothetical protein BDA99DRAFT_500540 [Phascolomyces articulosus]|uniref:Uncharacterized protein n=1 Tax=Phascolomyces articulosus TaxID=60185 RepID=A0AAD5K6C6_9FUNG|nr:hypothetical protein BDA99DRAFT_500540 [Phascolomyces articulosus]
MCDAIANLKFLKRFRSGMNFEAQVVDGPALIKMVEKSESLTHIRLNHITVTGIEIDNQDRDVDNENPLGICLTRQLNGFTSKILAQYRHGSNSSSEAGSSFTGLPGQEVSFRTSFFLKKGLVCYELQRNKMVGQTKIGFQKQETINKCSWKAST